MNTANEWVIAVSIFGNYVIKKLDFNGEFNQNMTCFMLVLFVLHNKVKPMSLGSKGASVIPYLWDFKKWLGKTNIIKHDLMMEECCVGIIRMVIAGCVTAVVFVWKAKLTTMIHCCSHMKSLTSHLSHRPALPRFCLLPP